MEIHGLQKLTLLDYPGALSAIIFTSRCSFSCPFCHNALLVNEEILSAKIPEEEVFDFLKKRRGVLSAVVITGGEPTLQKDLYETILKIRDLGYKVKLDTNGYKPDTLEFLINKSVLDYVALDVKNSKEKYSFTTNVKNLDISKIEKSIDILKENKVDYEFRTTVCKGLHTEDDLEEIGKWIEGGKRFFIQNYVDSENILSKHFAPFEKDELKRMKEIAQKYIKEVNIR